MNAVLCALDLARLSFALKDTLRQRVLHRSNTVRISSPASTRCSRSHRRAKPVGLAPLAAFSPWSDSSSQSEAQSFLNDLERAVNLLPEKFRSTVLDHEERLELIELVLDYGRKPLARFPSGDFVLSEELVSEEDLEDAVAAVGGFDDSNRAGLEGTLHRISCIRDRDFRIYGLTIRIGRAVTTETAELVKEPLVKKKSILLIGPPGVGKTSAIRNFCKMLSETCKKRVMIVDTSSEIAGPGRIPHRAVGESRRMQVRRRSDQHNVMVEAVQNHMPEVIVIDEIGRREECHAARAISQRGVQLLATTHGRRLEDMVKDRVLRELVGGVGDVIIGDKRADLLQKDKKIAQERVDASSFDVVVEMADRARWRIHYNANKAVDAILAGDSPEAEIRYLDGEGKMVVEVEEASQPEKKGKLTPALQHVTCTDSSIDSSSQSSVDWTNSFMTGTTSEAQYPPDVILPFGTMERKDVNSTRLAAEAEASRIVNASSDLEILQVKSSDSYELLKQRFNFLRDKLKKKNDEDEVVKKARARVSQAFDYLSFYCNNKADIDTEHLANNEALRILNASSDIEALQATEYTSKGGLQSLYSVLSKRIQKTEREHKGVSIARRRLTLAYTKLLRYFPS